MTKLDNAQVRFLKEYASPTGCITKVLPNDTISCDFSDTVRPDLGRQEFYNINDFFKFFCGRFPGYKEV